ncbi:UNVERIFIED_CONTAM: hypothetical protein GTU68_035403 [Idotea baltica]|nr:hypothetical protein [Idotea baltica]
MRYLITGGAGFIGSALIRHLLRSENCKLLNIDKLTYSGSLFSLADASTHPNYQFLALDITHRQAIEQALMAFKPERIIHLAAESHVDLSISGPEVFIQSNIVGTFTMLEASHQQNFCFHHVSTDEVYGDLNDPSTPFNEQSSYKPSSPYSASKAASDHLVKAWYRTYGLPVILSHSTNNYGPYQFPEKLIPLTIMNALLEKDIFLYGDGQQTRDWLFVDDHVKALHAIATQGKIGETYTVGGHNQHSNLHIVQSICSLLDTIKPHHSYPYAQRIQFTSDRPGHDRHYAVTTEKINKELQWYPKENFYSGLEKTVLWYVNNKDWALNSLDKKLV